MDKFDLSNFDMSKINMGKEVQDMMNRQHQIRNPITPEIEQELHENYKKKEAAQIAAIKTEKNTKETAEEVKALNNKVVQLSKDLEKERTDRSLSENKLRKENQRTVLENKKNEYIGRISTIFASLFSFLFTIAIFQFENLQNDNVSKWTVALFCLAIISHGIIIFWNIIMIILNGITMSKFKKENPNA